MIAQENVESYPQGSYTMAPRSVVIEHGPDGISVLELEDPTLGELGAIALLVALILGLAWIRRRAR